MHHKTPSKTHRPSISNTMQWLSRTSTQQPSKPTRISEPQLIRSIELLPQPRSGVLGSGATVVRTPEEALREARVRLMPDGSAGRPEKVKKPSQKQKHQVLSPPQSPPLPPLPVPEEDETHFLSESERPLPPSRAAPLPPSAYPQEDSPDNGVAQAPILEPGVINGSPVPSPDELTMLPISFGVPPVTPTAPFEPILLSEPPTTEISPANTIVTLETSTETYNTSMNTLFSQPSYLVDYIESLLPRGRTRSDASSVYSTASDIASVQKELSAPIYSSPCRIHIFLDRPSAP